MEKTKFTLDLYHPVDTSVEEEPSWYQLILDLLTIQSSFLGFSAFRLLTFSRKLPLFLIYLVCSFGFSWHTYHIFQLAIHSELTPSEFYEMSERIPMPEVLFCFQFNTNLINRTRKLTGHYLEELTSEMTTESIFKHVAYLNGSRWVTVSRESDFRIGSDLQISTFFFLDCKCFNLSLNRVYYRNEFHFTIESHVLKINFSKHAPRGVRFPGREYVIHLMTKSKGKIELSKIVKFPMDFSAFQTSVSHEVKEVRFEDKFNMLKRLFKDPLSLFQDEHDPNDVDFFIRNLLRNFWKKHQKVTSNLPIRRSLFNSEIDDRLFESYFNQTETNPKHENFNYRRQFAINRFKKAMKSYEQEEFDFLFKLVFFKKVILATNDENYTKLLLNLFNVLSIWFGIHILKLPTYLLKIKLLFKLFRRPCRGIRRKLFGSNQISQN